MTLIQTDNLNRVDPIAWLTDVLERSVSGRTKTHELDTFRSQERGGVNGLRRDRHVRNLRP